MFPFASDIFAATSKHILAQTMQLFVLWVDRMLEDVCLLSVLPPSACVYDLENTSHRNEVLLLLRVAAKNAQLWCYNAMVSLSLTLLRSSRSPFSHFFFKPIK
jgi:hypothetical protein